MTGPILRRWLCLAAPLPALILGVLAMARAGVPASLWGQNLAVGLVLATVCALLPATAIPPAGSPGWNAAAFGALGLLAATFLDPGLEGVHRWIQAGPVHLHAGAACLPLLILALGAKLRAAGDRRPGCLVLLAGSVCLLLLVLQPDAAQATAFAGALFVLLASGRKPATLTTPAAPFAVVGVVWAWKRPDPLLPVRYVEGIVGTAAQNGAPWRLGALLALAFLPLPFLFAALDNDRPTATALGVYFLLCLLGSFFGVFPVPVMGFGLSPMIGYFLALGWLVARENRALT